MQGWNCFHASLKSQYSKGRPWMNNQHGFTSRHHSGILHGSHSFYPHAFVSSINGSSSITVPSSPISSAKSDILAPISPVKHI